MKHGRTLQGLLEEVMRQQETKRDFVADTRALRMSHDLDLKVGDLKIGINDLAHGQIAEHVGIPKAYYDKMRKEAPDLLATNVDRWFQKYPAQRMVRTLDGKARAFLSDRYRPLDNSDLLEAALPPLMDMGVEVMSCEVTASRLYLKVVDQRIRRDLPVGWTPENRGHQHFDTVCPALVLSNSEVGHGSLAVQTSVWTGGCSNLAVIKERSTRKYHVGGRMDIGEEIYKMLSAETRKITDAAIWAQLKDVTKAAFDQAHFDATVDRLKLATEDHIEGDPVKVVEITAKKFGMNDGERGNILKHLIKSGDLSRYGLHSAVTRASQDVEDYDRASQLELIGGNIIELPRNDWRQLAEAA